MVGMGSSSSVGPKVIEGGFGVWELLGGVGKFCPESRRLSGFGRCEVGLVS